MKFRLYILPFIIFGFLFSSFSTPSLTVNISNLRNSKGQVLFAVFNQKKGFPSKQNQAFIRKIANIKNKQATYAFYNLKKGEYAIAAVHDGNFNSKIDKNFIGVPIEGYGFSNVSNPNLIIPSFKKASFNLQNQTKKISIPLFYAF